MPASARAIANHLRIRPRAQLVFRREPAPVQDRKPRRLLDVGSFFQSLVRYGLHTDDAAILTKAAARHVARDLPMPDLVHAWKEPQVSSDTSSHFLGIGSGYPDLHEMNKAVVEASGKSDAVLVCMFPAPAEDPYLVKWINHIRVEDPVAHAKLAKMSFADMCRVAQQFQWSLHRKGKKAIRHQLRSCPVVHRYEDGWSWVWLETDQQRDAEGEVMDHCVGNGTYDDPKPDCGLFSLRDPQGQPTVTAQIRYGSLDHHETGKGAPHHRVVEPRLIELAKRCGSYMLLHGRPGWATDEEIVAEEAGRRDRKRRGLEHKIASFEAMLASPPAGEGLSGRGWEMGVRRDLHRCRVDLAKLNGWDAPEKDPVLADHDIRLGGTLDIWAVKRRWKGGLTHSR